MPAAFGIEDDGRYAGEYAPGYETELGTQTIGGRGMCSWQFENMPLNLAEALRARLEDILALLKQEIESAS